MLETLNPFALLLMFAAIAIAILGLTSAVRYAGKNIVAAIDRQTQSMKEYDEEYIRLLRNDAD
jgi:hypothetical protein